MSLMLQSIATRSRLQAEGMPIIFAIMLCLLIRVAIRLQRLLTRAAGYSESFSGLTKSYRSSIRILRKLPTVTVKLHNVTTEFLPPIPCALHATDGPCRQCANCDFRALCSSAAGTLLPQLPCSSAGSRIRRILHTTGQETTATDDDPNSEHYQHTAGSDRNTWTHLSLEVSPFLLSGAAMARDICLRPV